MLAFSIVNALGQIHINQLGLAQVDVRKRSARQCDIIEGRPAKIAIYESRIRQSPLFEPFAVSHGAKPPLSGAS